MLSETDNIRVHYHLLFSLTWIFSLMFYPVWVEPTSSLIRTFIYITASLWTIINVLCFHNFLVKKNIQPIHSSFFPIKKDKFFIVLLCLLSINILLHLYPISFPLMISDDEAAHAGSGLGLITRLLWMKGLDPAIYFDYIRISLWLLLLSALVMISSTKIRSWVQRFFMTVISKYYLSVFIVFIVCSTVVFFLTVKMNFFMMLMRYPPIGKILYATSISLFGINEFAVRLPQLLFTTFSSILIYRICEEHLDSKETGLISASFYTFSPMVFYYSGLAELISGTVFFSIVIIYFYLKHVKTGNSGYLLMSFYMISLGFLFKQDIVIMLAVLTVCVLFLKENKIKASLFLKLSYFSLVPILPYIVIGKIYPNNPFAMELSNWLSAGPAFGYLAVLPKQLSYPLVAVFAISMVFIISNRTIMLRPAVFVSFTCFLLYYFFYTSTTLNAELYQFLYMSHENGSFIMGNERYSMILFPFISISIGLFINKILKSIKWKHSFAIAFSVFTIYLILICTLWQVPPLNAQFVAYKNIDSHYFPVDKAMKWVKDNVKDGQRVLILRVAPSTFYRDKYWIERDKVVDFWYDLQEISSPEKLTLFCMKNKISYIMFSYNLVEYIEILQYLKDNSLNEFHEEAVFHLDENYIYIYKLKDIHT